MYKNFENYLKRVHEFDIMMRILYYLKVKSDEETSR